MVFASLLFVFLFFAANILSQIIIPTAKWKNVVMLIFSLIFYSWAGPRYLILLLLMVFICKVGAISIEDSKLEGKSPKKALYLTVAACLTILGIFKYTGFLFSTFDNITGLDVPIPEIVLPVGISFYTFQLISYVVDVYRGEVEAQRKYWLLLLYACLFHQCIAGPIVRYKDVNQDLMLRKPTLQEIGKGVTRFSIGLAKKAILANSCAVIADHFLQVDMETLMAEPVLGIILGLFAFQMQVYFDFSAYSDMAIGMGLMCGLHYKENFNYPFISKSMSELWQRWHISLGSFFRDYLYIPLGGSHCSTLKILRNIFIVWFLTGLWHGASWNFVLWGLYFGVILAIHKFIIKDFFSWVPDIIKILVTFWLFVFSVAIFTYPDLDMIIVAVKGVFGLNGNPLSSMDVVLTFKNNLYFLILCCIMATPLGNYPRVLLEKWSYESDLAFIIYGIIEILMPVVLLIMAANALAGDTYNPFLYFRF